jgi:hypothetical protein
MWSARKIKGKSIKISKAYSYRTIRYPFNDKITDKISSKLMFHHLGNGFCQVDAKIENKDKNKVKKLRKQILYFNGV